VEKKYDTRVEVLEERSEGKGVSETWPCRFKSRVFVKETLEVSLQSQPPAGRGSNSSLYKNLPRDQKDKKHNSSQRAVLRPDTGGDWILDFWPFTRWKRVC